MIPAKMKEVGEVKHYYAEIGVAVVELEDDLHQGDRIVILGKTTEFGQYATSIEKMHEQVSEARAGEVVGIKIFDHARPHDKVYVAV